jgi:hypothetical protein
MATKAAGDEKEPETSLPGGGEDDVAEGDSLIVPSSSSGDDDALPRLSRPLGSSATRWDNAVPGFARRLWLSCAPQRRHPACLATVSLLVLAGVFHLGRLEAKKEVGGGGGGGGGEAASSGAGTFTRKRLDATRAEASKVLSLLEEYYSGADAARAMLMKPWLDPWEFDDLHWPEKRDRNAKLVDTLARALVTDNQRTFLVGAIGSSVMAGHDNCHYDSYQSQMERLWQPVWEAAGMNFVVQNAGEGGGCGDSFQNQGMCITQNVSPNVDVGTWGTTRRVNREDDAVCSRGIPSVAHLRPASPPPPLSPLVLDLFRGSVEGGGGLGQVDANAAEAAPRPPVQHRHGPRRRITIGEALRQVRDQLLLHAFGVR